MGVAAIKHRHKFTDPLWLLAVGLAISVAPFLATSYQKSVLLLTFMYIALAMSWNLIGGYAGYFTFGHIAYFGIGAYTAALSIAAFDIHWLSAAALAAGLAAAIAAVVGYPSLRVKGPAFVILTLAFSQTLRIATHIFDTWNAWREWNFASLQAVAGPCLFRVCRGSAHGNRNDVVDRSLGIRPTAQGDPRR
jgi:ABC-type branched-subunit amino acid transport system permease subunit